MELLNTKSQASLKARLYVKLQGKKIQELSLMGLYHMISACLTIVLTSESSEDMVRFFFFNLSIECFFLNLQSVVFQNTGDVSKSQTEIHFFRGGNGYAPDLCKPGT
jgi:hypothetical protein